MSFEERAKICNGLTSTDVKRENARSAATPTVSLGYVRASNWRKSLIRQSRIGIKSARVGTDMWTGLWNVIIYAMNSQADLNKSRRIKLMTIASRVVMAFLVFKARSLYYHAVYFGLSKMLRKTWVTEHICFQSKIGARVSAMGLMFRVAVFLPFWVTRSDHLALGRWSGIIVASWAALRFPTSRVRSIYYHAVYYWLSKMMRYNWPSNRKFVFLRQNGVI